MTRKLNTTLMWQKSTYSGKDGNCVEIARLDESAVAVRDSKAPRGRSSPFRSRPGRLCFRISTADVLVAPDDAAVPHHDDEPSDWSAVLAEGAQPRPACSC